MIKEDNKINLLLISPLPPPSGGIATWTNNFLNIVKDYNINAYVINTAVSGNRYMNINEKRNLYEEVKRSKRIFSDLMVSLKKYQIDIAHLNTSCSFFGIVRDYFTVKIIKKYKVPVVIHYHCNLEDQIMDRKIQKYFLKKLSTLSSHNLVLNKNSQEYLKNNFNQDSEIINNFIRKEFVLVESKTIREDLAKILFVGHVRESKGIKEILRAARMFPNIIFVIAGPIANEIHKIKTTNNVEFRGKVSPGEIKVLLDECDVFLFPTLSEGFSVALLEAMARGLPIITTSVGANMEMIENQGGILVRTKTPQDIIDAIYQLKSKQKRERMSTWNIEKVNRKYISEHVMSMLVRIYKKDVF